MSWVFMLWLKVTSPRLWINCHFIALLLLFFFSFKAAALDLCKKKKHWPLRHAWLNTRTSRRRCFHQWMGVSHMFGCCSAKLMTQQNWLFDTFVFQIKEAFFSITCTRDVWMNPQFRTSEETSGYCHTRRIIGFISVFSWTPLKDKLKWRKTSFSALLTLLPPFFIAKIPTISHHSSIHAGLSLLRLCLLWGHWRAACSSDFLFSARLQRKPCRILLENFLETLSKCPQSCDFKSSLSFWSRRFRLSGLVCCAMRKMLSHPQKPPFFRWIWKVKHGCLPSTAAAAGFPCSDLQAGRNCLSSKSKL